MFFAQAAATAVGTAPRVPAPLETIDTLIIVGFLLLVTAVGYFLSNMASKGLEDYFLGGRSIPWWVLGISTATSNFDMSGTMIIVAVVYSLGFRGFLVEMRGGVGLSLAFLMVFLGKWLRRSRVMTSAEWMKLRFGKDKQGRYAHLLSAIANTVLSLGMIVYFCKGGGKFLENFLPWSELTCTVLMVSIGLFYTLMSGLYGVVFTDVIQMILLNFTAIYITFKAFAIRPLVKLSPEFLEFNLNAPKHLGKNLLTKAPDTWEPILGFFGICVFMWIFRSVLEGFGGVGGYTDQRFFAARSEREAGLLTLESILLSILRWTMVAGLVILGYHLVQNTPAGMAAAAADIGRDAEQVLPVVLGSLIPSGIRGFVIAGLIAAAMSTFDSTLNAGASYITKDIYASYVNPKASGEQLMSASRWATLGLCVGGVALATIVPNINQIWDIITMGLGLGMFVPLFLRWYWPRFNGYGFAIGTAAGIGGAIVFKTIMHLPLYHAFPAIIGTAFVASIVGTLMTPPTEKRILRDFWLQINPFGFWGKIADEAVEAGEITGKERLKRTIEQLNDFIAICFSFPFQICSLMAAMSFVFHAWEKFAIFSTISLLSALGLYFFWYRNLKSEADCTAEDEIYDVKTAELVNG